MKGLWLTLLGGCSFVLTSGPSDRSNPPRAYPRCTTSMTWPIVDGVFSGIFIAGIASAIAESEPMPVDDEDEPSKAEKITSLALFAAATGIGAYVGYTRVSSCRASREQFRAAYPYGLQPYAPQPYYPQPYQPQGYPQPYPPAAPQPYPSQPQPYPPPAPQPAPSSPAAPQPAPAARQPSPPSPPAALGTEGDVCAATSECTTGLSCTNNVCVRPRATP